jgi:hypothetical protein
MVKERARQGATNSARGENTSASAVLAVPPPKPRAPPPKMLSEEDFVATAKKKKLAKGGTATWKIDEVEDHDYKPAHQFNDKEHLHSLNAPVVKGYETQRRDMRTFAVDRLRATAKERYGTVADLFNAVRIYTIYMYYYIYIYTIIYIV